MDINGVYDGYDGRRYIFRDGTAILSGDSGDGYEYKLALSDYDIEYSVKQFRSQLQFMSVEELESLGNSVSQDVEV